MSNSLLPPSPEPFERAISLVNMERLAQIRVKARILETLWDAWNCPEGELHLLAWALSVDYWSPHWSVARRRKVVSEALAYHRRKTTVAGIRMALGYRDVELVSYHLPRHGFFIDPPVDAEEQARWLDGLPEIRIYDPAPAVLDGDAGGFLDLDFFIDGDALEARTAAILDNGEETPVVIARRGDEERIVLPVQVPDIMFLDEPSSNFIGPETITEAVLAVRPVGSGADDFARPLATPGDLGAFVSARRRALPTSFPPFSALGDGDNFIAPVTISCGYLALKFSRQAGRHTAHEPLNVVGFSRITPPGYEAEWTADLSEVVPYSPEPEGCWVDPPATTRVEEVKDAIRSASALRDTNYLSLQATRRLTFADLRSVKPGQRFGDRRRNIAYV